MRYKETTYGLVYDRRSLAVWLRNAEPGDKTVYYSGFLGKDRDKDPSGTWRKKTAIDTLAREVYELQEGGQALLCQKKHDVGQYDYIVVKT